MECQDYVDNNSKFGLVRWKPIVDNEMSTHCPRYSIIQVAVPRSNPARTVCITYAVGLAVARAVNMVLDVDSKAGLNWSWRVHDLRLVQ